MGSRSTVAGRVLLIIAGLALVSSAAFSIGELRATRSHSARVNAPAAAPSSLSGLSLSGLQHLESQVSQAAALAQGATGANADSTELSQLEQQLGISPSASTASQLEQLQTELNNINTCLGGSPTATLSAC
jgi:hypothetical protein